jgi:hypothetical protein
MMPYPVRGPFRWLYLLVICLMIAGIGVGLQAFNT